GPGRLHRDQHVRDLELDPLERPDGPPEGLPVLRVAHALVEAALGQADPEGRDGDAAVVERLEELRESPAAFAEEVLLGDPAVAERQLVRVAGVPSELAVALAHLEALGALRDDDRGDLLAAVRVLAGDRGDRADPA